MSERDGIRFARIALAYYRAGLSPVEESTAIIDLIADLMHVADATSGDDSISGEYAVDRAAEYYRGEDDEESDEEDDFKAIDFNPSLTPFDTDHDARRSGAGDEDDKKCEECDHTISLTSSHISTDHGLACSLHPGNVVG